MLSHDRMVLCDPARLVAALLGSAHLGRVDWSFGSGIHRISGLVLTTSAATLSLSFSFTLSTFVGPTFTGELLTIDRFLLEVLV